MHVCVNLCPLYVHIYIYGTGSKKERETESATHRKYGTHETEAETHLQSPKSEIPDTRIGATKPHTQDSSLARRQDMSTLVRRMNLALEIPSIVVIIVVGNPKLSPGWSFW